ncbi:annexin A7-like [Paramacrobiotus metropolitanus]|uniref:annexin A7-like n=1 Tax=Paramacrobiotus metropolitanus TaxID=2943436 RepID=UPI00244595F0|nr:annexin A7-like [Paramacrobiotus metropolitanus]
MPDVPMIKDFDLFDPKTDADLIQMALQSRMHGSWEILVIDILTHRSNRQRQQIVLAYAETYGQDLVEVLKNELGSQMEDVVTAMFLTPDVYDAVALHEALEGNVLDEEALIEIIFTRTNPELLALRDAYATLYDRDLVEDFTCKSSGDFQRLLLAIALGIRDEVDEAADPIQILDQAKLEAQLLYEPIAEKLPTSQFASTFIIILANPSFPQLRITLSEFEKLVKMDTERIINRSLNGNLALALLALVRITKNKEGFFAEQLYRALQGFGRDDKRLIRLVVSRSEKDLASIKTEFEKQYKIGLDTVITGDNSYGYRSVLASIVRG